MAQAQPPSVDSAPETPKKTEGIPLFFQADKNNVRVLPQRFEYSLVDEDQIKIGDILISSQNFGFQIAASTRFPGKYRARFIWPSGLIKEGDLFIKDNSGKAVWTTNFHRKNIRLIDDPTPRAELVVDQLNPVLIEDMKYFPFMNFCLSKASSGTRIHLCSREVYLTHSSKNRLTIKPRSKGEAPTFVEINGKEVSPQGTIYLNNENENIAFRAKTTSGALLEIETRMRAVDFKDAILSADQKEITLTASGAEPVNEEKVKRLSSEEWQVTLDSQRPVLYLKGEGHIPMRQELFIEGPVPSTELRPSLSKDSLNRLYKSHVEVLGTSAPGTTVSADEKSGEVEKLEGNEFRWKIHHIPQGEVSRHYLRVTHPQGSAIAGYDLYREFPFEAGATLTHWTSSNQTFGDLYLSRWFENFFGSGSEWARLRWGAQAKYSHMLTNKKETPDMNIVHVDVLWRAKPGFHFKDPTWGLSLPVEMLQGTGFSTMAFGVGFFYSQQAQKRYQKYLNWYDVKLNYLLGGSGTTLKLKRALQLSMLAYLPVNQQRFSWSYGGGIQQYSFDPGESEMQIHVQGGVHYRF